LYACSGGSDGDPETPFYVAVYSSDVDIQEGLQDWLEADYEPVGVPGYFQYY
jgi:hypothetical protein